MEVARGNHLDQLALIKALFGRPGRVVLAVWISQRRGEPFYQNEAQIALVRYGIAMSAVASELRTLVNYGMVSEFRESHRVYFTEIDSPLWKPFISIGEAVGFSLA